MVAQPYVSIVNPLITIIAASLRMLEMGLPFCIVSMGLVIIRSDTSRFRGFAVDPVRQSVS